jgi:hypothetical protein
MGQGRIGMGEGRIGMDQRRIGMGEGRIGMDEGRIGMGEGRIGMGDRRIWEHVNCTMEIVINTHARTIQAVSLQMSAFPPTHKILLILRRLFPYTMLTDLFL